MNTSSAARDIAVDAGGNVYVTGESYAPVCPLGGADYLTLKLSQPLTPAEEPDVLPAGYALGQSRPNPFLGSTTISYTLPEAVHVRLEVYDVLGRLVRTLVDAPQAKGTHEVAFVAAGLPAGVYTYRMRAGAFRETRRVVLLE
ncbi:MAG: T9SS type A sorting domain-containing protein [Bacteroidetes bacterium]|nr:T9SS type A sorting domain-containing protein [Bacteroidota bacterium]